VSDSLDITISSITPGFQLSTIGLIESGDYQITNFGGNPSVRATGTLSGGGKSDSFDTGVLNTPTNSAKWDGAAEINDLALDTVVVTITNELEATTSNAGDLANIANKVTGGSVGLIVKPVPVPAAAWLFGSGILGMAAAARRRKSN
jgi:hypothetical protein